MNQAVLLIAAYLSLLPVMYLVIRSGAFGKGSIGTLLKLFFLGIAVAVPAFLMEAGLLLAVTVLLRLLRGGEYNGGFLLLSCLLRYVFATALVEELCRLFVLRAATWKQMTMEKISDGTAAAAVVGTGFSAVMFLAWLAAWHVVPADMTALRAAMPDYLRAGAVVSFLFALLYIPSHFGYSGLMGSLYGVAKGSEQKKHGGRAGFMLFVSFTIPFLVHSLCLVLIGYGIAAEALLWTGLGLIVEALLAAAVMRSLAGARGGEGLLEDTADEGVDFADSEEFAEFAEAAGENDGPCIGAEGEAVPGAGAEGEAEAVPGAGAEAEAEAVPGAGAEAEAEAVPGAGVEPEAEAVPGAGVEPEAEAVPGAGVEPEETEAEDAKTDANLF